MIFLFVAVAVVVGRLLVGRGDSVLRAKHYYILHLSPRKILRITGYVLGVNAIISWRFDSKYRNSPISS